jgi:signal transduction histidine kinase
VVLSALTLDYLFIHPIHSFALGPGDLATLVFFTGEGITAAYGIDYLRANEARLRQSNEELAQAVANKGQLLAEHETRLGNLIAQLTSTEERERRQLAAELHDYLAQLLTLARMKANQAQRVRASQEGARHLQEADQLLQKSLDYVRTLMADLHPPQLEEGGFLAALRFLARQMPQHGLTVDLVIDREDVELPPDHAKLLYQSIRELLMNVVKHAGVDRARVSITSDLNQVVTTVEDEGKGFDLLSVQGNGDGKHFGLASVHERMTALGGTFSCKSAVGHGSTMSLTLPLPSSLGSLRAAGSMQRDRVKANLSDLLEGRCLTP